MFWYVVTDVWNEPTFGVVDYDAGVIRTQKKNNLYSFLPSHIVLFETATVYTSTVRVKFEFGLTRTKSCSRHSSLSDV